MFEWPIAAQTAWTHCLGEPDWAVLPQIGRGRLFLNFRQMPATPLFAPTLVSTETAHSRWPSSKVAIGNTLSMVCKRAAAFQ